MPPLANSRHEKFAQELAEGHSATEAYERAGYKPNYGNCIRLKGNERIVARVRELQHGGAVRVICDQNSLNPLRVRFPKFYKTKIPQTPNCIKPRSPL